MANRYRAKEEEGYRRKRSSADEEVSSRSSGSRRGFAAMDEVTQREIASMGGKAAHRSGHAHEFDAREAREAGRLGGKARWGRYERPEERNGERNSPQDADRPLDRHTERRAERSGENHDDYPRGRTPGGTSRRPFALNEGEGNRESNRTNGRSSQGAPPRSGGYAEDEDRRPHAYDYAEDDYRPRPRRYERPYEPVSARAHHARPSTEARGDSFSPRYDEDGRWPSRRDRDDYEDRPYRRAS